MRTRQPAAPKKMPNFDSIISWLEDTLIEQSFSAAIPQNIHTDNRKTTRGQKRRLPSPSSEGQHNSTSSHCSKMNDPSTPKRPRLADVVNDPQYRLSPSSSRNGDDEEEDTPRPSKSARGTSSRSGRSSNRSSPSRKTASTTSSPGRKLAGMALEDDGMITRQLGIGDERAPEVLVDMTAKIYGWSRHKAIIGSRVRHTLDDRLMRQWWLGEDVFSTEHNDDGSTLELERVNEILLYARDCFEKQHSEMVWNIEVQQRLLEMLFRTGDRPYLVDFTSW